MIAMAFARICRATVVTTLALSIGTLAARAQAVNEFEPAVQPSNLFGSYLAGRSADASNDLDAALAYFNTALEFDRGFSALTERVFILHLAAGEIDRALELAEKLLITNPGDPIARLTLAVAAFKGGNYDLAKRQIQDTHDSPLATLTAGLLDAWADQGLGKTEEAFATVDGLTGPDWYAIFQHYHRALIADIAGRTVEADEAITKAYDSESAALRIVQSYSRIKARSGYRDEALRALTEYDENAAANPIVKHLLTQFEDGKEPESVATTAQAGAAELLYGLGTAIGTEDGSRLAAVYLQLAHYLDPSIDVVSVALGDIFHRANQCDKAVDVYAKVPNSSPVHRNAAIQTGICLDTLGRTDAGAKHIKRAIDADPNDITAALALGNIYRNHDRFAEAGEAYSIAASAITDETDADWRIFYFRGVSYERTERWSDAEADFKRALEINPDQPQVLNYLGYSWVDMGRNLEEALDMIRTAVDLRPNDGYIVDSLGWAYYRLERYDDAVEQLERAVERRPEDPVINDHLGDAYWQVGRKREAKFQWTHARDLEPDETDLPIILAKIENGLTATPSAPESEGGKNTTAAIDATDDTSSSSITVKIGDNLSRIAERIYGDPDLYFQIFDANRDTLVDPDIIYPGMTLTIPRRVTN